MSEVDERPRRRQARGERRVTQLLRAAASVFCTQGYTAASTNAIAREAGVSPGTLYQFFPNKEAIAVELGSRMVREMEDTHGRVFTAETARLPLDELITTVTNPFLDFNIANPAFFTLIKGPDTPGRVAEEHDVLHATLLDRIAWIVLLRCPSLSRIERTLVAEMSFAMFKAACELILNSEGERRAAYAEELRGMLYRYLAPYLGTGPMDIGERETAAAEAVLAAEQAFDAADQAPGTGNSGDTGTDEPKRAHPSPGTAGSATSRPLPTGS